MEKNELIKRFNEIQSAIAAGDPATVDADIEALIESLSKQRITVDDDDALFWHKSLAWITAIRKFENHDYAGCISDASTYITLETIKGTPDVQWAHLMQWAHLIRGKSYLFKEDTDPEKCLFDLKAVEAVDPDTDALDPSLHVELYRYRGEALLRLGRASEAIKAFQKAFQEVLRLAPDDPYPCHLTEIGRAFLKTEEYDSAIKCLQEAARLSPNDPNILSALGRAFFQIDNCERAEAILTAAIVLKPDDPELYKHRAVIRKKLGKKSASEDWMIARFLNRETP
jgi:tetratricopeptide (TPR) repeat protein